MVCAVLIGFCPLRCCFCVAVERSCVFSVCCFCVVFGNGATCVLCLWSCCCTPEPVLLFALFLALFNDKQGFWLLP